MSILDTAHSTPIVMQVVRHEALNNDITLVTFEYTPRSNSGPPQRITARMERGG